MPEEIDLHGRQPAELQAIGAALDEQLLALHQTDEGELRDLSGADAAEFDRLSRQRDAVGARLRQHEAGMAAYRSGRGIVTTYSNFPGGEPADRGGWVTAPGADRQLAGFRRAAMTMLEHRQRADELSAEAADRCDTVLRHGDAQGLTARYLAAVGDEAYATAFAKMVQDPSTGHLRFSPAEVEAVRAATLAAAAAEYRAGPLITSGTGFPLPVQLDTSIIRTGAGALNPVRGLATVSTIGAHDWQGVSSDGITASYDQEGTEVSDDTPALAGPVIHTQRGTAFVPVSIEAMTDWPSVQQEMEQLITDARDVLDGTAMLTGNGSNTLYGIFGGDAVYSLSTSQRVLTAGTAAYAVADPWSLKAQIPARFLGRTTFAAHPNTFDTTFRFVGGNSTEPYQFSGGDRSGDFLGRPRAEWSAMATGTTSGTKLLVGGDWKTAYRIVDRLGMSAEIVQHLVGTNHRPTGNRGIFVWWRTGAAVVGANALRYLESK